MKKTLYIFLLLIIFSSCSNQKHHFVDESGNILKEHDDIAQFLYQFYGENMTDKITVKYIDDGSSGFDPESKTVFLGLNSKEHKDLLLAHEGSHVVLGQMTDGISNTENFRFIDEGWASILGARAIEKEDEYRLSSIQSAYKTKSGRGISFNQVEKWSEYFGPWDSIELTSGKRDFTAYDVGTTFIYYIIDNYGKTGLKSLFKDIGETKNLNKSLKKLTGKNKPAVEKEWLAYIDTEYTKIKDNPNLKPPNIISFTPENGATKINPNIEELVVKFDIPMNSQICVIADCKEICWKNAKWKDSKTLVIDLPKRLEANRGYQVGLGSNKHDCLLKSSLGENLEPVLWKFKTK